MRRGLRHTCASLLRAAGAGVKALQQQVGHRNATDTLNTYTHLFEGDLAKVMDRLDTHSATGSRPGRILGDVVDLLMRSRNPRCAGVLVAPGVRLELTTYGLTVRRSAN